MLEFVTLDGSTIVGALVVFLVLAVLRFGDALVDRLLSYRSSPVESVEESIPERNR